MKLLTRVNEGSSGIWLFRKPVFLMDVRVELEDDELRLLRVDPGAVEMPIATATAGNHRSPVEIAFTLGALLTGISAIRFANLSRQTEFEESLAHGCRSARNRLLKSAGSRGTIRTLDLSD